MTMPESPGGPAHADPTSLFTFDGGPTGNVYFYGFDGGYLGTMQLPGF